ncbi:MAG: M16 family metallopeptidase, partial [Aggregatilineales bacterium]
TTYYETLPADRIELALSAEADRMTGALFDPDDTESERNVVIAERHDNENSPTFWLNEAMRATAFMVHGYHHEIIGDMPDLKTMSREALIAHYHKHYVPANATVIGVGAFETPAMLEKIHAYYGDLPHCEKPDLFMRPEPEQQGERRVHIERPGQTAFVRVAHRVPPARHDDWFSLEILDSVLTGPGGGVDNKTSRLYRALVKTGIAASIGGGLQETIDPYLYTTGIKLNDGHDHETAERILLEELAKIQDEGITEHELKRAKKQAVAAFAYSTESVTNRAYWMAQGAALGDIHWLAHYMERLNRVTLADVQQVAQQYLIPRNRTVGWLIPVRQERA